MRLSARVEQPRCAAKPRMPAQRPVVTGSAQSTRWNQQPDFSQGRRGRPVPTHDEAAGGGNRTLQCTSGERSALARENGSISAVWHREHVQGSRRRIQWLDLTARRKAPCRSLALAADAGYRDCSCRGAEREAESHACKFTLATLPRELMPNPSLKRSANGRPPAPGRRYAVHIRRPGAGVLPLSPA